MGVKPVEYVKDSSTSGFAVAGDEKPITQTNANTIQKDVNQGNTKDLDNAQDRYLSSLVDEDSIDYNPDEQKNVGKNRIDTEGANKIGAGSSIASSATTVGAAAGAAVAGAMVQATTVTVTAGTISSEAITIGGMTIPAKEVQLTTTKTQAADGFLQLIMSGILLASGLASAVLAYTLDPTLSDKIDQTNNAEQNNQTIQSYYDTLTEDMDTMVNDSERYKKLLDGKTQSDINMITELGVLQAELAVYQAQGDTEKAAEIQAKIDEIKNGAKDDPTGTELGEIKEGLEAYAGHNNESVGVAESGATVADFLKQGNALETIATINAVLLGLCSLYCIGAVIGMFPKLAPFFPDIAGNVPAKVMMGAAGAAFAVGAYKMSDTAMKEGKAGNAGNQMAEYVANLNENIEAQGGFTEETSAGYAEGDAQYTQVTQQTQEGVDQALQNQQGRLNPENNPTGTPDNNPNPEPEPVVPAA